MYENFVQKNPINLNGIVMNEPVTFPVLDSTPFMPGGRLYMQMMNADLKAVAYTDWRDETLSWHLTCSISGGLNPTPVAVIKGPDAAEFLKKYTVNNIDKFPVGSTKHGIMCLENGLITAQGVLMRTDEDAYEAHWLSPYLNYVFMQEKYDATIEDLTGRRVIFQTQGPCSLEMLENAAEEDLHDIGFCRFRESYIADKKVRIFRFGMYGCLGYEVHCDPEDAHTVYRKILEAGMPLGVRRLGFEGYMLDHTPGGSQQLGLHFMPAMDPGMMEFMTPKGQEEADMAEAGLSMNWSMTGSLGDDVMKRLVNPLEMGLESIIDFSHDFVGRDALLAYKNRPNRRSLVTLKWNYEDLGDIYMSQFRDEEPYFPMDWPGKPWSAVYGGMDIEMDVVLDKDGKEIGYSAGRTTDYWHRAMVSLGVIDDELAKLGDEVIVVWGNPGSRQKNVRAEIVPFPFNTHFRNKTFDVETIPHYKAR